MPATLTTTTPIASARAASVGPVFLGLGALLLHGGLAGTIVLLWFDPAVSGRLATMVASHPRGATTGDSTSS